MQDTTTTPATRETYLAAGGGVEHESAVLSIGDEFMPACAIAVRDGSGDPTPEYWRFLTEQLEANNA